MSLDARRHRGLLRSLWRADEHRSHQIRSEQRSERRGWKAALRRGEEPVEPEPRPRRVGRRSLDIFPLTLRAFTRWALRVGAPGWGRASPPRGERLAAVLAELRPGRLRSAAARHLLRLDFFSPSAWCGWHTRFVDRLTPWQQRRHRRYQEAIHLDWHDRMDMLRAFSEDDGLRALFNERLAQAHRPPTQALRWHPWLDHLFREHPDELGVSPPRLLSPDEQKARAGWAGSSPEYELFDALWAARFRKRLLSLSLGARAVGWIRTPCSARIYRRHERGRRASQPGLVVDPRRHPEGWDVLARFFELWRAGIRDVAALREATLPHSLPQPTLT